MSRERPTINEFVQAIRWYRQAIELRQLEDGQQLEERAQA